MTPEQASEDRFAVFAGPRWGFRALAIVLLNYVRVHGLNTARGIVGRFAPPGENNTDAYLAAFCQAVGVGADTPLDFTKPDLLAAACKAIAVHEAGGWFFSNGDLTTGVQMAET